MHTSEPWFKPPIPKTAKKIAVVGAGLAGCSISYELSRAGLSVTLIDRAIKVAGAASGNPHAILKPHVSRCDSLNNKFNLVAFTQTLQRLKLLLHSGHHIDHALPGVVQLLQKSGSWPLLSGTRTCEPAQTKRLTNLPIQVPSLHFVDAGWLNAEQFCQALVASSNTIELRLSTEVITIDKRQDGWILKTNATGNNEHRCDAVVFTTGVPSQQFDCLANLPLTPSAGQTTTCRYRDGLTRPNCVITGKRFLVPHEGLCTIGATHQRNSVDSAPDAVADIENIDSMALLDPHLPDRLEPIGNWRAVRVSTPDRLPLVGALPDFSYYAKAYTALRHGPRHQNWPAAQYLPGVYVLTGLGSRGLVHATLSAQLLSRIITGAIIDDDATAHDFRALVHPARFAIRALRRSDTCIFTEHKPQ